MCHEVNDQEVTMLNQSPETLASLMVRVEDYLANPANGDHAVSRIEIMELADGSGRIAALLHGITHLANGDDREKYLRIAAPAPAVAPAWALREHDEWEVEEVQYA